MIRLRICDFGLRIEAAVQFLFKQDRRLWTLDVGLWTFEPESRALTLPQGMRINTRVRELSIHHVERRLQSVGGTGANCDSECSGFYDEPHSTIIEA